MWSGSTHPVGTPGRTVTSTTSPENNNEAIFEEMGALHPVHGSTWAFRRLKHFVEDFLDKPDEHHLETNKGLKLFCF